MLKTIIVDDEEPCRETLDIFIRQYCPDVQVVHKADSIDDAFENIILKKPELVLLDISLPPSDGFELLGRFRHIPFEFIFTTAFNQYAIQALRLSAADYLLKPIDPVELVNAIDRVREKLRGKKPEAANQGGKIVLYTDKSMIFVQPTDIIRAEIQDKRVLVVMTDSRKLEVVKTLNEIEELLDAHTFLRSHRSHIINLNEIKEYIPDKHGGCVIMTDGKMVPIAERRKSDFMRMFKI